MIVRFFVILQRKWTYEIEYTLEICRMVFINLITIIIPVIIYRIPGIATRAFLIILFVVAYVFWLIYIRYSVGRFIQIKYNRKYATHINYYQLVQIMDAYPKKDLYCKINGKYKRIRSASEVKADDEIVLITIGKKQLQDLKKIKKIIENK